MAKKKHTRSSKRPLFIALLVVMLLTTVVFAFVGCNTRNKAEEQDEEQTDEYPEAEDPPVEEEEKEDEKEEKEKKEEEEKKEEPSKPVTPPVTTTPSIPVVNPTPKPTPTPSKPVSPPANTNKYGNITITKDGRYSETKTYNNVTIKADEVKLRNKTIKGDLIIDKSVDDDSVITLENVDVAGEIIINGGYDFRLYDVNADMLKVKKRSGRVKLSAYDKTEIENVETYRSIYLKEDDLAKGYGGFVNLTTKESSNIYIEVELFNCDLEGLYCNDITKVKGMDDKVYIDTVKAYDRVDLGSRVSVDKFTAYESGCTYVIEPDDIYTKNGANEPERYKSKDKKSSSSGSSKPSREKLAKPTNVNVTFSGGVPTITWDSVSGTSSYSVTYTINGSTSSVGVNNATNYALPKATSTQTVSAYVKAIGDGTDYTDSDVSSTATKTITKLSTPTNLKVEFSAGVPTVSWDAVANAQNYSLTYTVNGTSKSVSVDGISLLLDKVADNTTVAVQVKAIGNGSSYLDSEYSNAESTWTPTKTKLDTPSAPPTITPIKSADGMSITATIVYTNTGGTYVVEYSTDGGASYTEGSAITNPITKPCTITARVKQKGDGITTLDSEYATSAVTEITQVAVPTPNITIDGLGVITITPNNSFYGIDDATAPTDYDSSNKPTATVGKTVYAKVVDTGSTNTELGNTTTNSIVVEKLATPSGFSLDTSTNTLSWNKIDGATGYKVTINTSTPETKTVDTESIDLSNYVGQQINSIDVIAKAVGKLDSDKGTLNHTQTELKTPTPSNAIYSGTELTLTFGSNVLDATNADYTIEVTDASSTDITIGDLDLTSTNQIKVPVTLTTDDKPLPDGTYNVTVTATANNISVYTSNGNKTIAETYKLILPTTP